MVLPSEVASDLRETMFCEALAEVHGDLPRHSNLPRIIFRLEVVNAKFVMSSDRPLNLLHCNSDRLIVFGYIANRVLREHLRDGQAAQGRDGNQPHQRPFEFPYVALNFARYKERNVVGQGYAVKISLSLKDRDLSFEIGPFNGCY